MDCLLVHPVHVCVRVWYFSVTVSQVTVNGGQYKAPSPAGSMYCSVICRSCIATLGKLLTPLCFDHQAV